MENTFPVRLRLKRKSLGLSQIQLATVLGCSNITVSNWECGKTFPKGKLLVKVMVLLYGEIAEELKTPEPVASIPQKFRGPGFEVRRTQRGIVVVKGSDIVWRDSK
jgi:transcriptional regulator with XRE-family HTH domain